MQYFQANFYDRYTPLTEEQIRAQLSPAVRPVSAGPLWDGLNGSRVKIRLDDGAVLQYYFGKDTLSLWEDGRACPDAPYAALELNGMVLLCHMIPGTLRGYAVALEPSARLATVFDVWFCGFEPDKREVWRTYRFGCIEAEDAPPPERRHTLTNRIEGTGLYWRDDDGVRSLVFYPSVVWSSFVELSDPRGGITKTAPSDYIRFSDRMYLYSRVEQEYSGAMTLEIIDLFTLRHIGLRLGFDGDDRLVFRLFRGEGERTGRCTNLELLTDPGTTIPYGELHLAQLKKQGRGARPSYRPRFMHPDYSQSEVDEIVRTNTRLFQNASIMASRNTMETTDALAGLQMTFRYDDGTALEYRFLDAGTLEWRPSGGEWQKEPYEATEPAENLYFFSHLCSGSSPLRCLTHAADLSEGLTTCVDAVLGNGRKPWEVGHHAVFGVIEREGGPTPPVTRRHGFTRDLLGKAFAWSYSSVMQSIHVYSTPESYSWTIMLEGNAGGWMWSSPCMYVKLREDVYLFSWTEDTCNGNQGTFVLNQRIMHDAGFFFGIGESGGAPDVHLHAFGAFARPLSGFELDRFF